MRGMQRVGTREKPTFSTIAPAETSASFPYDRTVMNLASIFCKKFSKKLPKLTAAISASEGHSGSLICIRYIYVRSQWFSAQTDPSFEQLILYSDILVGKF